MNVFKSINSFLFNRSDSKILKSESERNSLGVVDHGSWSNISSISAISSAEATNVSTSYASWSEARGIVEGKSSCSSCAANEKDLFLKCKVLSNVRT